MESCSKPLPEGLHLYLSLKKELEGTTNNMYSAGQTLKCSFKSIQQQLASDIYITVEVTFQKSELSCFPLFLCFTFIWFVLQVAVSRVNDRHGWLIQCNEPLQFMSLHIPEENR